MFRHVVQMTFKREMSEEEFTRFQQVHDDLGAQAPTVRGFSHGPDAGVRPGGASYALVADFDDADGWKAYGAHPAHDVVRELMGELDVVGGISVVQFYFD